MSYKSVIKLSWIESIKFNSRKPVKLFRNSSKMRRLTTLSVFLVLTMLTENTRGHKKCLDDNTVYHGYNLVNARLIRNKKNTSMECQKACQHYPRWSTGLGWRNVAEEDPNPNPPGGVKLATAICIQSKERKEKTATMYLALNIVGM